MTSPQVEMLLGHKKRETLLSWSQQGDTDLTNIGSPYSLKSQPLFLPPSNREVLKLALIIGIDNMTRLKAQEIHVK